MYYLIGLFLLILVKIRTAVQGYRRPKPFSTSEHEALSIDYDIEVVENWLNNLEKNSVDREWIYGKSVLELGPGSDVGTGVILLASGANKYTAVDVNNLMTETSPSFYNNLIKKLDESRKYPFLNVAKEAVEDLVSGDSSSNIEYHCRENFDLSNMFNENSFDLLVSQAAFEHFANIEKTISQLSPLLKKDGKLVIVVDLMTHTRWIRDVDPNNIYRFPAWLYKALNYPGAPNRKRPYHYLNALTANGWIDISIEAIQDLDQFGLKVDSHGNLHKDFLSEKNQMEMLEIVIVATKV